MADNMVPPDPGVAENAVPKPGDVVNGWVLGSDNQWYPAPLLSTTTLGEEPPRKRNGLKIGLIVAACVVGLAVAWLAWGVVANAMRGDNPITGPSETKFQQVGSLCQYEQGGKREVTYSATFVEVDTGSEYGSLDPLTCVLTQFDVSDALVAQMEQTNSLMGYQQATENGYSFGWSYHPDNGFNLIVKAE